MQAVKLNFLSIPKDPRGIIYRHLPAAGIFCLLDVSKKTRAQALPHFKNRLQWLGVSSDKTWNVAHYKRAYLSLFWSWSSSTIHRLIQTAFENESFRTVWELIRERRHETRRKIRCEIDLELGIMTRSGKAKLEKQKSLRARVSSQFRCKIETLVYYSLDGGREDQAIALLEALPQEKGAWITNGEKYSLFPGWLYNSIKTASVDGYHKFLNVLFNEWLPQHQDLINVTERDIAYFIGCSIDSGNEHCALLLAKKLDCSLLPLASRAVIGGQWETALSLMTESNLHCESPLDAYDKLLSSAIDRIRKAENDPGQDVVDFFYDVLKAKPEIGNHPETLALAALLDQYDYLNGVKDSEIDLTGYMPWDIHDWTVEAEESPFVRLLKHLEFRHLRFERFIRWLSRLNLKDSVRESLAEYVKRIGHGTCDDCTQLIDELKAGLKGPRESRSKRHKPDD